MHNGFVDKRRRHLNLRQMQVDNVLPEHFGEYYPKFLTLLDKYYDWQGEHQSTELLSHLFATRDINETDLTLLSFIEDELLLGESYFEGFGQTEAEKRAAANFSNILFRSKGSKFAIEWFFRSFYGIDAEVVYTKENVFKASDVDSRLGPDSLRYLTNDELYQTFALLVRVGVPISKWKDIFKKFAHPAGMYLGGEVLLTSAVDIATTAIGDSANAITRATTTYDLSADSVVVLEGQPTLFTVTGTDVPDGIDSLFYYVQHLSTSQEDFADAVPPLVDSKQYLDINSSIGTFTLRTIVDSDDDPLASEQYRVHLVDRQDRPLDNITITVTNAVPAYDLNVLPGLAATEGDTISYTITGTNIPYDGNVNLKWYLTHGTTNDSDFSVRPPQSFDSASTVSIIDGEGTFTITTVVDEASESTETFTVTLVDRLNAIQATANMTLANVASAFNLEVVEDEVFEGATVAAILTINENEVNDLFTKNITGTGRYTAGPVNFYPTQIDPSIISLPTVLNTAYDGDSTGTFIVTNTVTGATRSDTIVIKDIAPTYTIEVDNAIAEEGDTVVFSVGGTSIPPTTIYFEILHDTTTDADFSSAPPQTGSRQSVTSVNFGDTLYTATFASNGDANDESFTARIYSAATDGTLLASLPFIIKGTSVSDVLTRSASSVNEGDSFTFTFTTNGSDGLYYYWIDNTGNASSADFTVLTYANFTSMKSFTVSGGVGTFVITTTADGLTELGNETFGVRVSATNGGAPIAELGNNTIINTSTATYTLTDGVQVTEGSNLTMDINISSGETETLYFEVTGAGVTSRFPITQKSATLTSGTIPVFATTSTNSYEGPQTGTMTVRRGSHAGTVLDTATFTLNDLPLSMTVTPDVTSADEGSGVVFTVAGTNIPNGTYYWRETTYIKASQTSTSTPVGVSIIYLNSTAGLTIGMETDSLGIPGTISFVGASYITMSSPTLLEISNGTVLHWALPGYFADADAMHGSFSVTSNAGVWSITFAENNDTSNDLFTFGVFASEISGTELANSGAITVVDTTATATVFSSPSSFTVTNSDSGLFARAAIKFWNDGRITSTRINNQSVTTQNRGNWVTDVALLTDPSAFEIFVHLNSVFAGGGTARPFEGDEDTWLNLGTSQEFAASVLANGSNREAETSVNATMTIREIDDPGNTFSFTVIFDAFVY